MRSLKGAENYFLQVGGSAFVGRAQPALFRGTAQGFLMGTARGSLTGTAQGGASILEYLLALVFFGFVVLGMVAFFQPSAERFHKDVDAGSYVPYPNNYIEASPSPVPSP